MAGLARSALGLRGVGFRTKVSGCGSCGAESLRPRIRKARESSKLLQHGLLAVGSGIVLP